LANPTFFAPGFGLEAEISLIRSLGVWASGAYFLSGTWDLETGLRWHLSPQFALSLQALFLFDVVDGFVPQLGAGVRWSFPLNAAGSWTFFNEVGLYVPPCGALRAALLRCGDRPAILTGFRSLWTRRDGGTFAPIAFNP